LYLTRILEEEVKLIQKNDFGEYSIEKIILFLKELNDIEDLL
jgi:hypothetical protein